MHRMSSLLGLLVLTLTAACYHATVETGLPPGTQTIEKSFASGWIYGLIPPATVSTASRCPSGVARVETQHSFVNMLVGGITWGIYTPMNIKVTCAASRADVGANAAPRLAVRADAPASVLQAVFATAATAAQTAGSPAFVQFVTVTQAAR